MDRKSEGGKIRLLSTPAPLTGHALVIALSRTRSEVETCDRYGLTKLLSPSDSIHLVCGADCYVGYGSKRRVRSIAYRAPVSQIAPPPDIHDSGMCGFNRYPLPDESTQHRKCLTFASNYGKRVEYLWDDPIDCFSDDERAA